MTLAPERREYLHGYEAPIKRALWERILTFGVPRVWAAFWTCLCLYAALLCMVGLGFKWVLVPAIVWMVGHGILIGLTLWDANWDDIGLAQLRQRYQPFYDAG